MKGGRSMSHDWRPEIVRMAQVKQMLNDADVEKLWEFHLPKVAASQDSLTELERALGFRLDPQYREFLSYANGWPWFMQSITLLGTEELAGGPEMAAAREMLAVLPTNWIEAEAPGADTVCPIGVTMEDRDMFVMPVGGGQQQPMVLWIAGEVVDRYRTFLDFFLAMIEYNLLGLKDLSTN